MTGRLTKGGVLEQLLDSHPAHANLEDALHAIEQVEAWAVTTMFEEREAVAVADGTRFDLCVGSGSLPDEVCVAALATKKPAEETAGS